LPNNIRNRPVPGWLKWLAAASLVPLLWLIFLAVDRPALSTVVNRMAADPLMLGLVLVAFAGAFAFRAYAWTLILPRLPYGQSWAGLHTALGGNHVLPLRLGEPLRVLSVVRRTGIGWQEATASTVTLRAADFFAIAVIGLVAGLGELSAWWTIVLVTGSGFMIGGVLWLRRLARSRAVNLPGPLALGLTAAAWLLEAVVIHQVSVWAGLDLGFSGAVLVTASAVVAQVVAVAPGGVGTYEAGGVAAMALLGVDPSVDNAVVLTAHVIKTAYALVVGAVATFLPSPGLFGRFQLGKPQPSGEPIPVGTSPDQPIVLFMPAYNEAATVGSVIARVPRQIVGRRVVTIVVDDGSSDETAELGRAAGAEVVRISPNRGLGAAVRTGLQEALTHDPVVISFCDADGEYAPEELENLVRPILDGEADYVAGSRFLGRIDRMHPHRRLGNVILTWLLSWVARRPISDGQTGYRALSRRAAESAEIIHDFNYAQVLTLDLLAKGMGYAEVPISYSFRTAGESFVKVGRYLRSVVPAVYREVNAR